MQLKVGSQFLFRGNEVIVSAGPEDRYYKSKNNILWPGKSWLLSFIGRDEKPFCNWVKEVNILYDLKLQNKTKKRKNNKMILKLTKQDLMMAATATVGWYHWEPTKVDVELSAKGDSHNISVVGVLIGGEQPHQEEFEGKQITARFNTKLIGKLVPALRAFGWEVTEDMDLDTDEMKKKLIGEKCDIYIKHRDYQGNPQEDITMWFPYGVSDSLPV